MTTQTEK